LKSAFPLNVAHVDVLCVSAFEVSCLRFQHVIKYNKCFVARGQQFLGRYVNALYSQYHNKCTTTRDIYIHYVNLDIRFLKLFDI